jgi:hypothetical protein
MLLRACNREEACYDMQSQDVGDQGEEEEGELLELRPATADTTPECGAPGGHLSGEQLTGARLS